MNSTATRFDPEQASKLFFKHGHTGWLGLRYSAHGDNWVELELPWREDLLGEPGEMLASGPIVSLMDMASGMAIWNTKGTFTPVATLDLRVDYQRPARERLGVFGRVECYRTTRSAAFVRGIAYDSSLDDPVAHIAGVFMTIAQDPRTADKAKTESQNRGESE
ncbi:MAG: PaaI family thioesterase [Pseudomonadota bacterium]